MIFINYRIKDSIDLVSLLHEYLVRDFGVENVFWDKHDLEAGRWSTQLEEAVKRCPVMLSIIGEKWDEVTFPKGHPKAGFPRLSDPEDWVRKEITVALSLHDSGHRVIPVLLQGRFLPSPEWLTNVGLGDLWDCQPRPLCSAPNHKADYEKLRDYILTACPTLQLKSPHRPSDAPPPHRPCHLTYSTLGELFIGREEFLKQLRLKFEAAHAAGRWPNHAVCGVGGLGKTQVAVEYALQYRDKYTAVLMVNADTPESLRSGIAGLAGVLYSDLDPATTDDIKEQKTLDWLQKHPGWLLIVDNADTEAARDAVTARLSQWATGHVLITARLNQWPHTVEALDLHVLGVDDAARFLLKATEGRRKVTPEDADQAKQLAGDDLDGLCLALEQAAAYIAERRISFAEYRQRWAGNLREVRTWADGVLMQYHPESEVSLSVATTWLTTFQQLPPASQRLLEMLSWLAPDPLPQRLIDHPEMQQQLQLVLGERSGVSPPREPLELGGLTPPRSPASSSPLPPGEGPGVRVPETATTATPAEPAASAVPLTEVDIETALIPLRRYSLLAHRPGDPEDSAGRVHRVMQLITRERLPPDQQRATLRAMLRAVNEYTPTESYDVQTWPVLEPLRPHLLAIIDFADGSGIAEPTTRLLSVMGELLGAKAQYKEAEPLMRRALAIDEQSFGTDHPNVATALNNLATLLQDTNRLGEAEPLMRRALAIDEQTFGTDHPDVARDLNNLASLLQATNRLVDAEPLMRRALAIDEQSFGTDHPSVATDLNNLAALLQDTNRLVDAEPLMARVVAIFEKSLGANHPNVGAALNNLAQLLQATNRLGEAEPLMRRALAIDEQSFGTDHPKIAIRLNNLASLLQDTNRLGDAEPLMRRALAIDEQSFGTDHPRVATDLNNLASLLQATNRLVDAEPLMRRALAIDEQSFGTDHPSVATDLNNLAALLQDTNRLVDAEPLMARVVAIFEKSLGANHPNVGAALNNLAQLLQATNRLGEAEPLMRRALAIDEQSFGTDHPKIAIRLNNLAQLLKATNRLGEAEPLMRRALAIFVASLGADHPSSQTVARNYQLLQAKME